MKNKYFIKAGVSKERLEAFGFNIDYDKERGVASHAIKFVTHYNDEDYELFVDFDGLITEQDRLVWNMDYYMQLDMEPFVVDLIEAGIVEVRVGYEE